ncbi:MAG: phage minor capsid protein [Clostridia bacterium]|nr:phage minor capsid protein [Clostridia bacterium]
MKEEAYAPDPLNKQASVLVDAQTDIKTAVKNGVLAAKSSAEIKKKLGDIIDRAVSRISSPTLKRDARISLMRFANKAYTEFTASLSTIPYNFLPYVIVLMRAITAKEPQGAYYVPATASERKAAEKLYYTVNNKGVPLQEFQKVYIRRVKTALNSMAQVQALDPNDFTGRNSLRNLAEMQVRYERHQAEIQDFKDRKVKLVVCSAHADCSDRCAEWQGRVYSMDGSEGYTEDGRHYVPLERATDVYYTTKAGRTYKNGLLGFNCRHKLYEYKEGMAIPRLSAEDRKREYAITLKQREMERGVIEARERALENKDADIAEYRRWRKVAQERNAAYMQFSKDNHRAYYPDRVKIL